MSAKIRESAPTESGEIDKIRKSANGNFALGNKPFEEEISEMLDRRVHRGKAGRPRKKNFQ